MTKIESRSLKWTSIKFQILTLLASSDVHEFTVLKNLPSPLSSARTFPFETATHREGIATTFAAEDADVVSSTMNNHQINNPLRSNQPLKIKNRQPLEYLVKNEIAGADISPQLKQKILHIKTFNPSVKYRPGHLNILADVLSRNPVCFI